MAAVSMRFAGTVCEGPAPVRGSVNVSTTSQPAASSGRIGPGGYFSVYANVSSGDAVTLTVDCGERFTTTTIVAIATAGQTVDLSTDIASGAASAPPQWAATGSAAVLTSAPELKMTKLKNTAPEVNGVTIKVLARDPATATTAPAVGAVLVATPTPILYGFSNNLLYKSTDDGTTWALFWTFTGYAAVEMCKVLRSGVILALCRVGSADASVYDIFQCTDGVNFAAIATQPFTRVTPFSRLLTSNSWSQMPNDGSPYADNIFMGEYGSIGGASNPAVRVFRSTDDGATWTTVTSFDPNGTAGTSTAYGPMALDQIRHIHEIKPDPFVAGRIWITIGDNLSGSVLGEPRIGFSDDAGATWTQITRSTKVAGPSTNTSYQQSRAVGLMFTSSAVFWFSDTPDANGYVYRYDRSSHAITQAAGPWPNAGQGCAHSWTLRDGTWMMMTVMSVEPLTQISRDDTFRAVGSTDNGATWHEILNWRRTQADQTNTAHGNYFTTPDANDEFWMSMNFLEGGEATSNWITGKFQAAKRPFVGRPRAAGWQRERFELAAREDIVTVVHPDTNGTGAAATINDYLFFRCPTDIIVVDFSITARTGLSGSATDYWTANVTMYATVTGSSKGAICQAGGASVNPGTRVVWPQVTANGLFKAAAGDWLSLGATKSGSAAALIDLTVSLRYRRTNVII